MRDESKYTEDEIELLFRKLVQKKDFFMWADKALIRTALGYELEQIDLTIETAKQ